MLKNGIDKFLTVTFGRGLLRRSSMSIFLLATIGFNDDLLKRALPQSTTFWKRNAGKY